MTIEESVKANPEKFQAVMDAKTPEIKNALEELSSKLDAIIGSAIGEYCAAEQVESVIGDVPSYKTMNGIITAKIDEVIKEHIAVKRKDIA